MQRLLIILSSADREPWAQQVVAKAMPGQPFIIVAGPADAARYLAEHTISPTHIVLDIGTRGHDVLLEIDALAQQCEPGTRVVAVGDTNDIQLFRAIIARGVMDYLPYPASDEAIVNALTAVPATPTPAPVPQAPVVAAPARSPNKRVILFMSAASGDGASTLALNTAYAMSQMSNGNTVLVDMDYQFGMVAKHLGYAKQATRNTLHIHRNDARRQLDDGGGRGFGHHDGFDIVGHRVADRGATDALEILGFDGFFELGAAAVDDRGHALGWHANFTQCAHHARGMRYGLES
jgi:ActR/RegA family two-component response regulator